ncbi:scavenger receptor class B member 1 [Helicoverpa armigera]|uniref:scavenger receptor class B member 1 n=1 Tax=Helicoverpa armigera TaxID=29058 RepID=UPI003082BEFF
MVLLTRRDAINARITSKNKILAVLLTGVVFLIVPILIIILDPIHLIIKYKLRLTKDSILYELLQQEMQAGRLSVYVFNITNSERFLSGEDYKLKVEEVGPFVFQEYRWYEDLEPSEDGTRMAMTAKVRTEFIPEESLAHPKDVILRLPNLPLLSSASLLSNYPSFIRSAFNLMITHLGAKPFLNLDVHNFLWGYNNPIIKILNGLAPGVVYFDSFGLLDRLYDNTSDYRIEVGATDKDRFEIKWVKKYRHLKMGGIEDVEESIQTFNNTYEAEGYPPNLTPEVPINFYRLGICRTFALQYIGSRIMDYGGEALIYTISNDTFMGEVDPITLKPYPYGVIDISKCYYGLPFVLSKSHFIDSDPILRERLEGLNPDRDVHINEVAIDRRVSVTYKTKLSLQVSMMVDDVSFNNMTKMLSNTVIPIAYARVDQPKLPEWMMSKLILVYQKAPIVVKCIIVVMLLISIALIFHAVRLVYLNRLTRSKVIVFKQTAGKILEKAERPLMRN